MRPKRTVTSPVLRRGKQEGGLYRSRDSGIVLCPWTVERYWDVPETAIRFWLEAGLDDPATGSMRFVVLRDRYGCLMWRTTHRKFQYVFGSAGLDRMAERLGIATGVEARVYVRLLYEE